MQHSKVSVQIGALLMLVGVGRVSRAEPNPASAHCASAGGQLEMVSEPQGQDGLCRFDRALIEEWTLYRAQGQAIEVFLSHPYLPASRPGALGLANPASVYCAAVGGDVEIVEDARHDQLGVCRFPDSTGIEEWTLFRGPSDPGNAALVQLLLRHRPSGAGGFQPLSAVDPDVIAAASFAVQQINARCNCLVPYQLEQVVDAKSQVVAGINYQLTLRLVRGDVEEVHQVVVFSQPWAQHLALTADTVL